jgi:hypothetical protein
MNENWGCVGLSLARSVACISIPWYVEGSVLSSYGILNGLPCHFATWSDAKAGHVVSLFTVFTEKLLPPSVC